MHWLRLRVSGRRTFSSDSQSSPCWSTWGVHTRSTAGEMVREETVMKKWQKELNTERADRDDEEDWLLKMMERGNKG